MFKKLDVETYQFINEIVITIYRDNEDGEVIGATYNKINWRDNG